MQMKNTTNADILHKSSGINFIASSYTQVPANNLAQLADDQTFNLLSSGSFILNDGINDITSPSNSWNAINKIVPQNLLVTTQYEMNDKDLKLAKSAAAVGENGIAVVSIRVPGTFGSEDGRYVAGGYAIAEDYHRDDYITVHITDTDRLIALVLAQSQDPNATTPLTDDQVKGLGVIPGFGAFPTYPVVRSYTDDDLPAENQGWYFWANAIGNNVNANGECEVEPIGGYGFLPSGFYIVLTYYRGGKLTTGSCRVNFYWGRKE